MLYRHGLGGLFAVLLGLMSNNAARADEIFVSNFTNGTIGEYTTSGATVNPAVISLALHTLTEPQRGPASQQTAAFCRLPEVAGRLIWEATDN